MTRAVGVLVVLLLLPVVGLPDGPPTQVSSPGESFILPLEVPVTWTYEVTMLDSTGAETPLGRATITLDRAVDFSFDKYFMSRPVTSLDTLIRVGPYKVTMTLPAGTKTSQFWNDRDDQRQVWFENGSGLYKAFQNVSISDFWLISLLLPIDPQAGVRWWFGNGARSEIESVGSSVIGGRQHPLVTVDWLHHGIPWHHTWKWALGLGLYEVREWVVEDGEQTGEIVVYRLLPGVVQRPLFIRLVPPSGYRAISVFEYLMEWRQQLNRFPTPDRAEGDFDGDGAPDRARLWIKDGGEGWVLMAYLSSRPEAPVQLEESTRPPWNRLLRTIGPGTHKTHRYYGIGPGGPDTTAVLLLERDAINLVTIESEGVTFVWNPRLRAFDRVDLY